MADYNLEVKRNFWDLLIENKGRITSKLIFQN